MPPVTLFPNPSVGLQAPGGGAGDGPNVEYPWEARDENSNPLSVVPAEHEFLLLDKLFRRGDAARMLALILGCSTGPTKFSNEGQTLG